jgi:hypothetical protein
MKGRRKKEKEVGVLVQNNVTNFSPLLFFEGIKLF